MRATRHRISPLLLTAAALVLPCAAQGFQETKTADRIRPHPRATGGRLVSFSARNVDADSNSSVVELDQVYVGMIGTDFWLHPGQNAVVVSYPYKNPQEGAQLTLIIELRGDSILVRAAKISTVCAGLMDQGATDADLAVWVEGARTRLRAKAEELTVVLLPSAPELDRDTCADRLQTPRYRNHSRVGSFRGGHLCGWRAHCPNTRDN